MTLNPPEEITMRNEVSRTIPDKETTTITPVVKQRKKYIRRKPVVKKSAEEIEKLKLYSQYLTKQNKKKLTLCPKCDKQGYAKYFVRPDNHKLVLKYAHSNEPPVRLSPKTYSDNRKPGFEKIWRECTIGNVITESEFRDIMGSNNKIKSEEIIPQLKPKQQKEKQLLITDLNIEAGKDFVRSEDFKTGTLHLRVTKYLIKTIDKKRGRLSRTRFIADILERVFND